MTDVVGGIDDNTARELALLEAEKKRRAAIAAEAAASKAVAAELAAAEAAAKASAITAALKPLPDTKAMSELVQAMQSEIITAYREILNDASQPAAARISAANALTDRGWGKSTSDIPVVVDDRESKKDLTARVLGMLTEKQLEELRAHE